MVMFDSTNLQNFFYNYQIITTSKSRILKVKNNCFALNKINFDLLQLIVKYKRQLIKNFINNYSYYQFKIIPYSYKNIKNLDYLRESKQIGYCYDLNKAYLTVLQENNLIDSDVYTEILKFYDSDKKKVMQVIGSVATRKKVETFVAGKLVKSEFKQDKNGVLAWNFLEYCVNEKIRDIYSKNYINCVYWWFDEIVFLNRIENYKDFQLKEKKILIDYNNNVIYFDTGEIREFSFLK